MISGLDLFTAAGEPDWIHVQYTHPVLDLVDEYRCRVIEHPTRHLEVQRRLRRAELAPGSEEAWAPIRWHVRIREIAKLAGLEP